MSMQVPALKRRNFLSLSSLLMAGQGLALPLPSKQAIFLSAASDNTEQHWLKAFTIENNRVETLYSHQLSERGHAVAVSPDDSLFVAVARRPGRFLLLGKVQSGEVTQHVEAPAGRHFYGHGVFSADGQTFYTTESDYEDMSGDSGRIGVWQVSQSDFTIQRLGEMPTFGVGPHELLLMPDQETLVIANGGIRTHPDSERENLNVDTMLPSLIYLHRQSGTLLEQRFLPSEFHQASIRHIDVNHLGQVAIAIQFEGEPFIRAPLIALHQQGQEIQTLMAPESVQSQLQQYVGSIRFDHSGRFFVASCPRANVLTFWDAQQASFVAQQRARDTCGVCAFADGFIYSAGTGLIRYFDLVRRELEELNDNDERFQGLFWDNHLAVV
jgi:hypothetical protein